MWGIHSQDSATGHLFDYCGHASFLMPVVLFEKRAVPSKVGTTLYHWIDYNREEPYMKDLNGRRELMVQVWYPAKEKGDESRTLYP